MEAEENQKIKLESPHRHHRQSARLAAVDYSLPGFYFITICTKNRECLFGEIVNGEMKLNEFGKIVKNEWTRTAKIRPNVTVDAFIVMPNHFHGIVRINERTGAGRRGVLQYAPTHASENAFHSPSQNLGAIVRGFKGATTKQINILRGFEANPVWQRNYYEHIIRTNESLHRVRGYIRDNPRNWETDQNNPKNIEHEEANRRAGNRRP